MNDTSKRDTRPEAAAAEPRNRPTAAVEGVRFSMAVGLLIAIVTLGFGAWWVWGLDRAAPVGEMAGTEVRLPAVAGFYAGEEIFFVHPEASDPDVAGMLTDMMDGSPVVMVSGLAEVPARALSDSYVFANGVEGNGPFGFQPDVFASAPGDADYSPLRKLTLVTWREEDEARELRSVEDITVAIDAGEIAAEQTEVVVNMPFLTCPTGHR